MDRRIQVQCFVPSCRKTSKSERNKVFVKVPKSLQSNWCRKVGIEYKPSMHLHCCEDHLNLQEDLENYYEWKLMKSIPRLKPTAKIQIFLQNNENIIKSVRTSCKGDNLPSTSKITYPEPNSAVLKELLLQTNMPKLPTTQSGRFSQPTNTGATRHGFKVAVATQCNIEKVDKSTSTKKPRNEKIPISPQTSQDTISICESENPSLYGGTTVTSETEVNTVKKEFIYRKTILEVIERKPKLYVGIPKQFYWLISYIARCSNVKELTLFITLLKLRQNDTVTRICDQFEISEYTFSKKFPQGIEVLASFFQNLIYMPSPTQIKKTLPLVFKIRYSNVQMILDAFEIEIEKPRLSPMHQAQTWSQYKNCNTIKYLIGCTPNGFVSFISKGYGGRISDKKLVEKSDLFEILPCNSTIMADRGFKEVESLLAQKNIKLLRPPSVYSNNQPTQQEVTDSKVIASLRVHVERVIRRIREFRFLKPHSVVHIKHVGYLDHMVLIACGLINLQNDIIRST